ncbi:MAG: hypothetical protein ACK5DD_02375 [Cyclobacteriaceae bacterium]|jgi:hypothetical protein
MKTNFLLTLVLSVAISDMHGQSVEKVFFGAERTEDYYLMLRPHSDKIAGVLVLLPGFGQLPESIFPESKLFNVAYANNLLTVAIAGGTKLYADEEVTAKLDRAFDHLLKKFSGVRKDQFIIGGYSAGGSIALRYTEACNQPTNQHRIAPRGVFTVDSPIDLFDIWGYFQREKEKNFSDAGVAEARFATDIMVREIGSPTTNPARYSELTPFYRENKQPGNEQYLMNTAVRVYEDTDINWQLRERRRSVEDMNLFSAAALINRLLLQGHTRAEFMPAKQPGYRSSGLRHPHSWSIVDEVELVQWSLSLINP